MVRGKYGMEYRAIRIWIVTFFASENGLPFLQKRFFFRRRAERLIKQRHDAWKDYDEYEGVQVCLTSKIFGFDFYLNEGKEN